MNTTRRRRKPAPSSRHPFRGGTWGGLAVVASLSGLSPDRLAELGASGDVRTLKIQGTVRYNLEDADLAFQDMENTNPRR